MLKTILIINIVILAYCADQIYELDCSNIVEIGKAVEMGLKLKKIKAESLTLAKLSSELEEGANGFKSTLGAIKKLKDIYGHKVLLQLSTQADQIQGIPNNSAEKTYNQLASALSEIRAVSRIYPELEKAQHIFDTMRSDINQFQSQANDLKIQQKTIDEYLKDESLIIDCEGHPFVLKNNLSSSSSTEEEEVHKVESKKTYSSPPIQPTAKSAGPKPTGKSADPKATPPTKQTRPSHPMAKKASLNLGVKKQVKGHQKHKQKHDKNKMINVQKKQ